MKSQWVGRNSIPGADSHSCRRLPSPVWWVLVLPLFLALLQPAAWTEKKDMQTFTYKTVGDLRIQADVYGSGKGKSKPVVVWIHGGALIVGDRTWTAGGELEALVDAGYIVVSIDYRLAPETKLESILEDVSDAFRWVRREGPGLFGAGPDRVAVLGKSAGGYLALMSGFCIDPRPRVVISLYGYGDIVGDWYSRPDPFYLEQPLVSEKEARRSVGGPVLTGSVGDPGRNRFYLFCRQKGLWPKEITGHDPRLEPDYFLPYCPLRNIDESYPPTFLLHGDADTDVPHRQSELLAEELKRHGVDYRFESVPGGPHGFDQRKGGLKDPDNAERFRNVLAFLNRYMGMEPDHDENGSR